MDFYVYNKKFENFVDVSDWNKTKIPKLLDLEILKRCYICKEFLNAPVLTKCNHTFCSYCIRYHLFLKNNCPLCEKEISENELKKEILLDEIIRRYVEIRQQLLNFLRIENENNAINNKNSSVGINIENAIIISSDEDTWIDINNYNEKYQNNNETNVNEQNGKQVSSDFIDNYFKKKKRKKTEKFTSNYHNDKNYIQKGKIELFFKPIKQSIESKLHNGNMLTYNAENDNQIKDRTSLLFTNKFEKLPRLDFSSLTTPNLRKKFEILRLPTQGTRAQLESRYNHYYILYNSNADSNRPVSEKNLKHKLSLWEKSKFPIKHKKSNIDTSEIYINHNDFSKKKWIKTYSHEFKILIESAKQNSLFQKTSEQPFFNSEICKDLIIKKNSTIDKTLNKIDINNFNFKYELENSPLFSK